MEPRSVIWHPQLECSGQSFIINWSGRWLGCLGPEVRWECRWNEMLPQEIPPRGAGSDKVDEPFKGRTGFNDWIHMEDKREGKQKNVTGFLIHSSERTDRLMTKTEFL